MTTPIDNLRELYNAFHAAANDFAFAEAVTTSNAELAVLINDVTARTRSVCADIKAAPLRELDELAEADSVEEPLDAYDPVWEVTVIKADERCPYVSVKAASAREANLRALAWADHESELPEPCVTDSGYMRSQNAGTHEIEPGLWSVGLEGW